jgi:hypothetical protein
VRSRSSKGRECVTNYLTSKRVRMRQGVIKWDIGVPLLSFFNCCFFFGFPYLIYHLTLLGFMWYSNYTGLKGKVVSWGFVAVPFEHWRRSIKAQLPVAFFSFLFLLGFKVYIIHAPLTAELALAQFYCLPEFIFVISSQK